MSTTSTRPQGLTRSVSDYAIRDHASTQRSQPKHVPMPASTYFCVHCGNGFEKRADWEKHEWVSHERQSYWPCPQPGCQAFFDSGKSFEAHHQAVHGCGNCHHASKMVQLLPERKAWACGFIGCKEVFLDWSKRCKHVGAHYEGLSKRHGNFRESPEWTYSTTVRNLLRQPELNEQFRRFMTKCHGRSKISWPKLDWLPDKCAELQRCLEYRDFQRGIPDVVHMAYRLGHPAYTSAAALQITSRPPTPPHEEPPLSAHAGSVRSRMRSRSVMSMASGVTMSPSSPTSQYATFKPYERSISTSHKSTLSVRTSDTPSYVSAKSFLGSPETRSPPHTRNTSPKRTPSLLSFKSEYSRPQTANKKRMVAREPEVRGTSSRALIDFLDAGPPTAPIMSEHRARRVPRASPMQSPDTYNLPLSPESGYLSYTPAPYTPAPYIPAPHGLHAVEESPNQQMSFDRSVSPLTDDEAKKHISFERPISPMIEIPQTNNEANREEEIVPTYSPIDDIQETILEFRLPSVPILQSHQFNKILPPTPGPPPSQSLPLPPPPPSFSLPSIVFPDTPTSVIGEFGEVPPSPMPPGFTDISNWPSPPPSAPAPRSPSPPRAPSPLQAPIYPQATTQRPRTANPRSQPETLKLLPPPKRARSSSRSRPRPLRWASITTIIDPPQPSPGVDFTFCLSQPLDSPPALDPLATHF